MCASDCPIEPFLRSRMAVRSALTQSCLDSMVLALKCNFWSVLAMMNLHGSPSWNSFTCSTDVI